MVRKDVVNIEKLQKDLNWKMSKINVKRLGKRVQLLDGLYRKLSFK